MSSTTFPSRKRKRDDATDMAKLRETVDHDTGEVYHVETTRQAKRRHQRNAGAAFKPTLGQINAADIWNKQEEKIRKDKEREDKKKRDKLKQEAKEARLRGIQQKMLDKGRISIEDTWGKVNASQNRLHRFFSAPKASETHALPITAGYLRQNSNDQAKKYDIATHAANESIHRQNISILEDLDYVFTNSPLSQNVENSLSQCNLSITSEATVLIQDCDEPSRQPMQIPAKPKSSQSSQSVMAPPKRVAASNSVHERVSKFVLSGQNSTGIEQKAVITQRSPLSEIKQSQFKIQAYEKLGAHDDSRARGNCLLVATQVVRDVLSGLCSQDLEDDFRDDDKENKSSVRFIEALRARAGAEKSPSHCHTSDRIEDHQLDNTFVDADEFDDEGIDDESLLSLAATQQPKRQLFASTKLECMTNSLHDDILFSDANLMLTSQDLFEQDLPLNESPKAGDSFAMEGMNDTDLLEGLEAFENDTEHIDDMVPQRGSASPRIEWNGGVDRPPKKKRRVLPWVKDPIPSLPDTPSDTEALTPSPSSQLTYK